MVVSKDVKHLVSRRVGKRVLMMGAEKAVKMDAKSVPVMAGKMETF